jgi:hypothetical protein
VSVPRIILVTLVAGLTAVGSAIGAPSGEIPFRTIAHASASGAKPKRPTVIVAVDANATQNIAALVREADAQRVQLVDLHVHALVAVFAGAKPSSGYAITVQRLVLRAGTLRVVVAQHAPAPGSYSLPAFTRPYDVLAIAPTPARGVEHWVLVTSRGHVLARSSS